MQQVTVREFRSGMASYLKVLPIQLTSRGKVVATITGVHNNTSGVHIDNGSVHKPSIKAKIAPNKPSSKPKIANLEPFVEMCKHGYQQTYCIHSKCDFYASWR